LDLLGPRGVLGSRPPVGTGRGSRRYQPEPLRPKVDVRAGRPVAPVAVHRAEGHAVIGPLAADHAALPRVAPQVVVLEGELESDLYGFAAARGEVHARKARRGYVGELGG